MATILRKQGQNILGGGGGGDANLEKATYETSPATKAHSVGDYIYYNNTVYKVTSAIAIDDTITVGTNVTADTGLDVDTQMYIDGLPGTADAPLGEQHTVTGNPLSFTTDSAQVSNKTIVSLEPIQAGSGDPSPSNVRTISGYDAIDISCSGLSIDDYTLEQGGTNGTESSVEKSSNTNRLRIFWIPVSKGDKIVPYITCNKAIEVSGSVWSTNAFGTNTYLQGISWTTNGSVFNITANGYLLILIRLAGGSDFTPSDVEVEINKATNSITIPAPDGTIYGGTLDVESGELVVDREIVIYDGSSDENWSREAILGGTYKFSIPTPTNSIQPSDEAIIVNRFKGVSFNNRDYTVLNTSFMKENDATSIIYSNVTLEGFKTWLSNNNVHIVYKIQPKTYYLSPHQVKLLQGANTVTTNGTSLSLTYRDGEVAQLSDLTGLADSVEGIDNELSKNSLAESITISSGDTLPSDGYVTAFYNNSSSGERNLKLNGKTLYANSYTPSSGFISYSIFAKKGMVVTFTNCACSFTPLI